MKYRVLFGPYARAQWPLCRVVGVKSDVLLLNETETLFTSVCPEIFSPVGDDGRKVCIDSGIGLICQGSREIDAANSNPFDFAIC